MGAGFSGMSVIGASRPDLPNGAISGPGPIDEPHEGPITGCSRCRDVPCAVPMRAASQILSRLSALSASASAL